MDTDKRLDSWKEIAAYLNRDVRTVIRWEKERGLPVRRVPGGKGHGVFALQRELEAWLRGNEEPAVSTIAILPFSTAGDVEGEYLGDGITESIIDRLSRVRQFRVMARNTVFSYKGRATDVRVIGKELGARAVALGSLTRRQLTCEIAAELVDMQDGARLWGGSYLVPTETIATIPARIASEIAQSLGIEAEAEICRPEGTRDARAFELCLRGRHFYYKVIDDENFKAATKCFEEAIARDPKYARASAGLAMCHLYRAIGYADMAPAELLAKSAEWANRALLLDENLAEAHLALACSTPHHTWDLRLAEHHFHRALELNPSFAEARHLYAYLLHSLGQFEEADAQLKIAIELDPTNLMLQADYAALLAYIGRAAEAIERAERCRPLLPGMPLIDFTIGIAHCTEGRFDEAIPALESCVQKGLMHTIPLGLLGYALAMSGNRAGALQILDRLERESTRRPACVSRAVVYAGLGDVEPTIHWLESAYRDRDLFLYQVNAWPWFAFIRNEPRFRKLVSDVGLVGQAASVAV